MESLGNGLHEGGNQCEPPIITSKSVNSIKNWRQAHTLLLSIRRSRETTVKSIWKPVGNNINCYLTYCTLLSHFPTVNFKYLKITLLGYCIMQSGTSWSTTQSLDRRVQNLGRLPPHEGRDTEVRDPLDI
jgi:hypothetical protein